MNQRVASVPQRLAMDFSSGQKLSHLLLLIKMLVVAVVVA